MLKDLGWAGPATLARLRAEGRDPTATEYARRKQRATMAARNAAVARWQAEHAETPDPETFRREILPALALLPLSRLMQATGLSLRYCSRIRRGEKIPHPLHWQALAQLAGITWEPIPHS